MLRGGPGGGDASPGEARRATRAAGASGLPADPRPDRRETLAALGLAEVPHLGPQAFRALVDAWGSAAAALEACAAGRALGRVPPEEAALAFRRRSLRRGLRAARPADPSRLEALEGRGIRLATYGAAGYPARLGHLHAPPPILHLEGPLGLPAAGAVAIVGSRRATEYGRRQSRDLAGALARLGWTVVSGLAAGIDGAAHRGALDAGGATVGVLGSGLDFTYPRSNARLYARIREQGLLASEFRPEERPRAGFFPRRNRIIAALAEAVVVVQAAHGSGALITADLALDLGREVLAVPGPVGPPASEGVFQLLREGARPAAGAADVLEALGGVGDGGAGRAPGAPRGAGAPSPAGRVLGALAYGPAAADDVALASGLPIREALSLLSRLELDGLVRALPGGRFEALLVPAGAAAEAGPGGTDRDRPRR